MVRARQNCRLHKFLYPKSLREIIQTLESSTVVVRAAKSETPEQLYFSKARPKPKRANGKKTGATLSTTPLSASPHRGRLIGDTILYSLAFSRQHQSYFRPHQIVLQLICLTKNIFGRKFQERSGKCVHAFGWVPTHLHHRSTSQHVVRGQRTAALCERRARKL